MPAPLPPSAACPGCGRESPFWVRKAGRAVHRCRSCALLWVPDGLVVNEAGTSLYEGDDPVFLKDGNEQYYLDETNFLSAREKVDWVLEHVAKGSKLLDAGANFGHFLKEAAPEFDAVGVELSPVAVDFSRKEFGVKNHAASVYALPEDLNGPHDVVTMWDVIEHVPRPDEALVRMREILKPGGLLFLSTPDAGSVVARLMRSRWHYIEPMQHIMLFNKKNLARLLDASGFDVIATRTFGHFYRIGYVLKQLAFLNPDGIVGKVLRTVQAAGRPFGARVVYIKAGDVMGMVARAR